MDMTEMHMRHELGRWGSLALRDAAGRTVTCVSGKLWLTMEGDTRDVVLEPGESFEVDRHGLTLLAAQTRTSVLVSAEQRNASGWWQTIVRAIDRRFGPAAIRGCRESVY